MKQLKTIASAIAIVLGVAVGSTTMTAMTATPAEAGPVKVKVFVGGKWIWKRHYHRRCGWVWRGHRHYKGGKWHKHRVRACW
jgi:hypothetical protein